MGWETRRAKALERTYQTRLLKREGKTLALTIAELLTNEQGQPFLETSEVRFRTSNNDLVGDMARISEATAWQLMVYLKLPVGFKSATRVPDRDQIAVVLTGALRVFGTENYESCLGPGDVFNLPQAQTSTHTLEVVGAEAVHLMVLQA